MGSHSRNTSNAPLRIGYSISLSGPLGANGQSARLAHKLWEQDVNRRGGLLGRRVEMLAVDDQTNASLVPGIYARLLDTDGVDLIIGGYGTNTILPAMPLVIERGRFFVGLMGLGVNAHLDYPNYFAMIGPQSAAVKATLGPLLNGFVNYEYWLPVPKMMFAGARELMDSYQSRAPAEGVDTLGYYMAPMAYAQMQVIEQAITATQGLDDERLGDYTRRSTFKTVVGDVTFGRHGEWASSRVLQVQFQGVEGHDVEQFKHPRTQVVVAPNDWASGELIYPYTIAR